MLRPEDDNEEKRDRKNIPERRNRVCKAQRGIPVTHRRPSPHPLKPTKIDSKSIKKVNSKGQERERGLEQVRNASKIWDDGKQKCE